MPIPYCTLPRHLDPLPSLSYPLQDIHQQHKYRNLDQGAHRTCQSLPATRAVDRDDNRDSKLKVVACSSKALRAANLVAEPHLPAEPDRTCKDDDEVDQERRANP